MLNGRRRSATFAEKSCVPSPSVLRAWLYLASDSDHAECAMVLSMIPSQFDASLYRVSGNAAGLPSC